MNLKTKNITIFLTIILLGVLVVTKNSQAIWTPPIGIPTPTWPADLDIARPTLPSTWTSDQAGFYFIQSSGCNDSRTYGNPTAARCSIPTSPPAGAVVVLNGTITGTKTIISNGTSESPVWIMGYNKDVPPTATGEWDLSGYTIVDHVNWALNLQGGVYVGDHIMLRDCAFSNQWGSSNYGMVVPYGTGSILYKITVSQTGNWRFAGPGDIDGHGVKVFSGANHIWIVDSKFYHCQGDGVQVGDQNNTPEQINFIYIGRNEAYENLQAGFWTKNATDVIFSENIAHSFRATTEYAAGQGMGGQNDATRVWFLANTIYDSDTGMAFGSSNQNNDGGPWYAIANLFYNIDSGDTDCNPYSSGGLFFRNTPPLTVVANTFYNNRMFVNSTINGNYRMYNNIFSGKTGLCDPFYQQGTWAQDYNLVSDASWVTEAHEKSEAPVATFTNPGTDFSIKSTSLAVGNANPAEDSAFADFQSRYGIDIRKDILGTARPQNNSWDIGAYEYSSVEADITPPSIPSGLIVL